MKKEEKFLVSLCRCYFKKDTPELPDGLDEKAFTELALHHNLVGVCHCVFNDNRGLAISNEMRRFFADRFFDLIFNYQVQSIALDKIKACFNEAKIPVITLKGAVLRDIYTVPESRAMGDIDLLIKAEDRQQALKQLDGLGFEFICADGIEDKFKGNNVFIELHTRLTGEFGDTAFNDAFDNAVEYKDALTLDDSYHLAYLIAHLANHLRYTGAGIGLVLDMAFLISKKQPDIQKSLDILSDIGLVTFGKAALSLCYNLFGCGKKYIENTDTLLEYLVRDGVFGAMRSSSGDTISRLMEVGSINQSSNSKGSSLKLKLQLAFPPYRIIRKAAYIPFINGRPWLLPLAWLYRLLYSLKNNRKHMVQTIKNIDDENTSVLLNEELKFFEEIGLKW